jgi:hypothetical protein
VKSRIPPVSKRRGRTPTEQAFDRAIVTLCLFGAVLVFMGGVHGPWFVSAILGGLAGLSWLRALFTLVRSWHSPGEGALRFSTCMLLFAGLMASLMLATSFGAR